MGSSGLNEHTPKTVAHDAPDLIGGFNLCHFHSYFKNNNFEIRCFGNRDLYIEIHLCSGRCVSKYKNFVPKYARILKGEWQRLKPPNRSPQIDPLSMVILQSHIRRQIHAEWFRREIVACQGRQEISLRGDAQVHSCRTTAIGP